MPPFGLSRIHHCSVQDLCPLSGYPGSITVACRWWSDISDVLVYLLWNVRIYVLLDQCIRQPNNINLIARWSWVHSRQHYQISIMLSSLLQLKISGNSHAQQKQHIRLLWKLLTLHTKVCYIMTMFRCPSNILITSRLLTRECNAEIT